MMAKELQIYRIAFVGLKPGKHIFQYEIDRSFFDLFEASPVKDGVLKVELELDKKNGFFMLDFRIDGTIKSVCDRCSEDFDLELMDDHSVIIKMEAIEHHTDVQEDVIFISPADTHLEVHQLIYEFILLSIPMKKAHPLSENGEPTCGDMIQSYFSTDEEVSEAEEEVDPRWKALKGLKK